MNGIGLVLAGGGGKGAYQIGVWKYLREAGLDKNVCAVSGTSVGALNAALFVTGDFERAEKIWRNMKPELILSPGSYSAEDVKTWLAESGIEAVTASRTLPSPTQTSRTLPSQTLPPASALAPAIADNISASAPFSREGLLQLMRGGVDFEAIRSASIPCYATCLTTPGYEIRRFDLRQYSAEDAQTLLLASSAIPVVFGKVTFQGETYCDGGVPFLGDNIPIAPVADLGVGYIIVVNLMRDVLINHAKYPDAKIVEITPQNDLGGLKDGTLDFTAEGAARRIEQGYADTQKALGGFVDAAMIHQQNELIFQAFEESERRYQDKLSMLQAQKKGALSQGVRDNYDEMLEAFAASGDMTESPGMDADALQEGVPTEDDVIII